MQDAALNFEIIFKSHYVMLCNAANNIVKDMNTAEDVVQDVFLKLWQKKDSLKISNYKTYLYKATIHAAFDFLKNNKRNLSFSDKEKIQAYENADSTIDGRELEIKIADALDRLPSKCKLIFLLSRYEQLKYKEIAEQLNISVKTVENQMGIALGKLRNELRPFLTREFISLLAMLAVLMLGYLIFRPL